MKKRTSDEPLYCVCRQPYEEERFMIECGVCNDWFHGDCVGIQEHQAEAIEDYHCPICALQNGPLILKKKNSDLGNSKKDRQRLGSNRTGTLVFVQELKMRNFASGEGAVLELSGHDLTEHFLNRNGGLNQLILIDKKDGLGLIVPPASFNVTDLETHVGPMKELDVIDVDRQCNIKMLMREWSEYYLSPVRPKILNLISLEFSNTSLADLVVAPEFVRKINLINRVWPKEAPFIKPAVDKYCLMGIADCFTDFHIDFGGSSVWYHVLKGEKLFYAIRPTTANLTLYEQWLKSSVQGSTFFGDQVDRCHRISVKAGQTLIIPSGWIHAVLTTTDTIAFGGNFLHFYNVGLQAQVYEIEKRTSTPGRFKFPHYETCYWYAARFLRHHLSLAREEKRPPHPMFFRAAKEMALVLKSWLSSKDYLVKSKDLIPEDLVPAKLSKDLAKQVAYVDKSALAENPVAPPQRPQRKNAGANMVVGRKGGRKAKEATENKTTTSKAKKAAAVAVVAVAAAAAEEKMMKEDPLRSPLLGASRPIPSSPTADPASVYDFDLEEDRDLSVDMAPLPGVRRSPASAAAAAAAVSQPAAEKPLKRGKKPGRPAKSEKATGKVDKVGKTGKTGKTGKRKKETRDEEEEGTFLSGEENLSPSASKRRKAEGKVEEEESSPTKRKKKNKLQEENAEKDLDDIIDSVVEATDVASTTANSVQSSAAVKGKRSLKTVKIKDSPRRKAETKVTAKSGDDVVRKSEPPVPDPKSAKHRVLADRNADHRGGGDVKSSKKDKTDKTNKTDKQRKKFEQQQQRQDEQRLLRRAAEDEGKSENVVEFGLDATKNYIDDRGNEDRRKKKRPKLRLNSVGGDNGEKHEEGSPTDRPIVASTSVNANVSPRLGPDVEDPTATASSPRRSSLVASAPTASPSADSAPSSGPAYPKLASPSSHSSMSPTHLQPQPMLSPTEHAPLKLRLSINKLFQAKLEGQASSTTMTSSDGEQSGAESESTMGSPPPSMKSPTWSVRRDPLGLSSPLPERQAGIFGLAHRSFSSPGRAGMSPIRSSFIAGSEPVSADATVPYRTSLLSSPRLLVGSPGGNDAACRTPSRDHPQPAGILFPNFMSSTPHPMPRPQRQMRNSWSSPQVSEADDVIKAAHEDKDYIYPALEISDLDEQGSGSVAKDDTWTPGAKCVPNCAKPEREKREGKRNEAVEKLKEDARNRLEGHPLKRHYVKKKKPGGSKDSGSSLLSMRMHGTTEPPEDALNSTVADEDEDPGESRSSLRIDLESRPSSSSGKPPPQLARTPSLSLSVRPEVKKGKKGFATAKQRLGKILKLNRMVH